MRFRGLQGARCSAKRCNSGEGRLEGDRSRGELGTDGDNCGRGKQGMRGRGRGQGGKGDVAESLATDACGTDACGNGKS